MTVTASNYARAENDLYQTEPWATEALLRALPPVALRRVWEPSAGNHLMADVLREAGADVFTSDIVVYDRAHDQIFDFLTGDLPPWPARSDFLITNPPYGKGNRDAVKYARIALMQCDGWVALLLTAKFDFGNTRHDLFRDNPRFHAKIALVDRISWAGNGETGTEDHAWYVWGPKDHRQSSARLFYEGKKPARAA